MYEFNKILEKIVDINSETFLVYFLNNFFSKKGWKTILQPVSLHHFNLYVYPRYTNNQRYIFATEIDLFTKNDLKYYYKKQNGFIYGKIFKTIITVLIITVLKLVDIGCTDIGLLFFISNNGIQKFLETNANPEAIILCTPTDLKLIRYTYGSLKVKINTYGKKVISCYPENGNNALTKLVDIINSIDKIKLNDNCNYNYYITNSGYNSNTITDIAEVEYLFYFDSKTNYQLIIDSLNSIVYKKGILQILSNCNYNRYYTNILTDSIDTTDIKYNTILSFIDIPNCKKIVIGPGNILNVNTENEHVKISDLEHAIEIYVEIVKNLECD